MKYLFFDLSTSLSAFALFENERLIDFNGKSFKDFECDGQMLKEFEIWIADIIYRSNADIIGAEDIFSQSVTGYKILSKLQGIFEKICYNYNKCIPMLINASEIRKQFDLNIGNRIMTEQEYIKKTKKQKNKKSYQEYLKSPNNYRNKFKDTDFTVCQNYYIKDNILYDIRKDKKKLLRKFKNGKTKITGSKLNEFDYAKKIVVVNFINKELKLDFCYTDNDYCDALLGGLYLIRKVEI